MDVIDHIAIEVNEIQEAIDWYSNRFSCEVKYADESWAMLEFANLRLALVSNSQHPPHIAFSRSDAADFGELSKHRDGTQSVYINDISGNSVEILLKEKI